MLAHGRRNDGHLNARVLVQGCSRDFPCRCEVCLNSAGYGRTQHGIISAAEGGDLPVQIYHSISRSTARTRYLARFPESKKIQIAFG